METGFLCFSAKDSKVSKTCFWVEQKTETETRTENHSAEEKPQEITEQNSEN